MFTSERLRNADGVWLEYDEEGGRDSFGRELAWVWYLPPMAHKLHLLNMELVESGNAWLYEGETSNRYRDLLLTASGSGQP